MAKAITQEDSFTTPKFITGRMFAISISGTFDGTVSLQRINTNEVPTDASDWKTVATYTAPIEQNGLDAGGHWYRIGIATGGYTSGTANVDVY